MRRRLIAIGLMVATFLALSLDVYAQKKGKGKIPATTIDSDKLNPGEYAGTLKSVPGTDRKFILEIQTAQLGPGGGRGYTGRGNTNAGRLLQLQAQLQQAQARIATARTPQQRQQAMNRVQQIQRQLQQAALGAARSGRGRGGKVNTVKQEIEFQASEQVKVRTMVLPEQFDEKGNVKKFTRAELAELKGKDKNLPGYESSLEKLEPGQIVRLVLAVGPARKANADADNLDADKRMQVKTIIVLAEGNDSAAPARKGKKNK